MRTPVFKEAVEAVVLERRIRAALLITSAMVACVCIGQLFAAGEVAFIMASERSSRTGRSTAPGAD